MARTFTPESTEFPIHISDRCINKEWFEIPMPEVWTIMSNYLFYIHKVYNVEILAFVLMSNHFHLIARFPDANRSVAMRYFLRETSYQISRRAGRINQVYGGRYDPSLINNPHYFLTAYKYVYRNPVEAGICNRVEVYPYSTLHGLLGLAQLQIPILSDDTLFENVEDTLSWLNQLPDRDHYEQVKKALKRPTFSFSTDRKTGKPSILELKKY